MTPTLWNSATTVLLLTAALSATGCWTAPNANVQPPGNPRLIQDGIAVQSVKEHLLVRSVDPARGTLVVESPDAATSTYKVSPKLSNLGGIKAGEQVRATVAEELTVYVLRDGKLSGTNGQTTTIATDARVLSVDPSYRLLTLQFSGGHSETFKVGLDVKLLQMAPGDEVVVRPVEVVAVRAR